MCTVTTHAEHTKREGETVSAAEKCPKNVPKVCQKCPKHLRTIQMFRRRADTVFASERASGAVGSWETDDAVVVQLERTDLSIRWGRAAADHGRSLLRVEKRFGSSHGSKKQYSRYWNIGTV